MKIIELGGTKRSELGTTAARRIRKEKLVPCVVYGKDTLMHINVNPHDLKSLVYTADFKIARITVDGEPIKCIVKNVQFNPVTDVIEHVDFYKLTDGHRIKFEIPVKFEGTSPGVKTGGVFIQNLRKIKVKTSPEYIVDHLMLNVSTLKLGFSLRVRDIEVNENIEILNAPGIPVASVEVPRALKDADTEEEEAAAAAAAAAAEVETVEE